MNPDAAAVSLSRGKKWQIEVPLQKLPPIDAIVTSSKTRAKETAAPLVSALGIAMVLIGVVFFFAFNWAGLHRFAKLALVALGVAALRPPDSY